MQSSEGDVTHGTLRKDMQRILTSLAADAFLGTTGAIATHSAYRSLLRNQLQRGRSGEGGKQLVERLMGNKPLSPPTAPLTIPPLALNRAAGAAGTLPPIMRDLLGQ